MEIPQGQGGAQLQLVCYSVGTPHNLPSTQGGCLMAVSHTMAAVSPAVAAISPAVAAISLCGGSLSVTDIEVESSADEYTLDGSDIVTFDD